MQVGRAPAGLIGSSPTTRQYTFDRVAIIVDAARRWKADVNRQRRAMPNARWWARPIPRFRFTLRWMMVGVAIVSVLTAIGIETWRRHQLAEFARKYRLGELEITGSERAIPRGPPFRLHGSIDALIPTRHA